MKKVWTAIQFEELCVMNTRGGSEGFATEQSHIDSPFAANHPEWFTEEGWKMSIGADNGRTPLTNPFLHNS